MNEKIHSSEFVPAEHASSEERQKFDALESVLGSDTFLRNDEDGILRERILEAADRYYRARSMKPTGQSGIDEFVLAEQSFQGILNHLVGTGQIGKEDKDIILQEIENVADDAYDRSQEIEQESGGE